MQHTKRYLLVPEDIYQSLAAPSPSDGTPIGLVRNRIKQIKNDDCINDAERAAKYEQELKRLNKLTKDEDERPVGVKLENLNDVVDAMPKPVNVRRPIVVATRRHLKFLYKDLSSPVAFTSAEPLLREARKTQPKINRADVQNYLATQRTYTLHRQAKRRYRRLPTLAPGLHTEWQADLAIFDRLAKQNRGYQYLLVCIDTLSRQVFVEPVKTKTSVNMIRAFGRIFKRSKYIPWKVLTDQGKEFTARTVQHFFRAKDVEHFCMLTSPQFHAGMAERANRSIKERLYRYFTERNTYTWIDVVQDIVRAINHSPNSSIGMRPADVNFKNAEALRQKLHNAAENVVRRQPRYRVGDRVRIEKYKHVFQKGYLPRFTNELFTVAEVHTERSPVVYRLRDDHNEIISGTVEQQFVQVEWQTGNTVRIELPLSNITNPHELSKNLYRLLGEGSDPLAKKVRSTQNSFKLVINKARRWAREEYIKRKTKEKRSIRDEELLLQALLTDTGTLVELNRVDHGLLAREKRAATSNVPLKMPADDNDSYQHKLDDYFSKLSDKNFSILDELCMTKLNAEIKNLTEDERALLEATNADTSVSAIQGIGQTFVQQLKVTVGNTEVYDSGNLYPFKAYITNELSFPINAKKNFLGSTGYYHTVNQDDSTDDGFKERFHDVKIYAKMVEVQPSLNMSLYKTLEKQPATYAVRKTEIKSSFISVGRYEFEYNVFSATIPRRVTIALVGNSAFHGDYKLSPFMFEPFDLREISDHFVSAFVDMYEALGMANSERSFDISMAQFKKGWTFFVIPLTSTLDDSCGFELLRSGTTNVRATFNSPIPLGGVEMIVLGEFDQMIMVDYNRHIVTDSKLG
ncbi:hypothetical protein niasHS_009480 [Heterodera schachtii]|uniref:Integrase catalytic domain-containing protein n=1 Tax=Heterodera schachtii TaxID=97005 RepID=A0ABD2JBC1_HETSC